MLVHPLPLPSLQVAVAALAFLVGACQPAPTDHYQGYVEGEFVFVSSPVGGTVERLAVREGDAVENGQLLFELEDEPQSLQVVEIEQRIAQARARHKDLKKGARHSELAAIDAHAEAARSALEGARRNLARRDAAVQGNSPAVSEEEVDRARTEMQLRAAEVASLVAERETLVLGAREDALYAAALEVAALEASLEEVRWQLDEKLVRASAAGTVHETLYRPGEFVPAGRPLLSMLPPENLRLRFFVPQSVLPLISHGDSVRVRIDGIDGDLQARVSFVSSRVEFTPPVIYSKQSREKLVVLIEATPTPEDAQRLRPGQPIEVRLD